MCKGRGVRFDIFFGLYEIPFSGVCERSAEAMSIVRRIYIRGDFVARRRRSRDGRLD